MWGPRVRSRDGVWGPRVRSRERWPAAGAWRRSAARGRCPVGKARRPSPARARCPTGEEPRRNPARVRRVLGRTGRCRTRATGPRGSAGAGRWSPPRSRRGRRYGAAARVARPGGAVCRRVRSARRPPGATIRRSPDARRWAARPGSARRLVAGAETWGRRRCPRLRGPGRASGGSGATYLTYRTYSMGRTDWRCRTWGGRGSPGIPDCRPAAPPAARLPSAGPRVLAGWSGGAGRRAVGASWGVGGRGRGALPCSCTPRFLMTGPDLVHRPSFRVPPCPARTRPTRHAYPHGRSVIPARPSGRGRSTHACASLYGLMQGEREPVHDPA
ncbi:hypothetical protein SAMN04487981_112253 [Streptomyces sp. cf386]|nr:hypothetical protein SAMN04487981_112253 [Streptomyces sp. cf386]